MSNDKFDEAEEKERESKAIEAKRAESAVKMLIAEMLYMLACDYYEEIATKRYVSVVKTACSRVGVDYNRSGRAIMEAIERKEAEDGQ